MVGKVSKPSQKVREELGVPPGGPGRVGRPFHRDRRVREAILEAREGWEAREGREAPPVGLVRLGGPPGGP